MQISLRFISDGHDGRQNGALMDGRAVPEHDSPIKDVAFGAEDIGASSFNSGNGRV